MELTKIKAIDKNTNLHTLPENANKYSEYYCFNCHGRLIFRNGDIRIPHFSHFINNPNCESQKTSYESQTHLDAKNHLKILLSSKKPIIVNTTCSICDKVSQHAHEVAPNTLIEVEYEFKYNKMRRIADVAQVENNKITYIFEVFYSSRTDPKYRPEPWYEFDAHTILLTQIDSKEISLSCIRNRVCSSCVDLQNCATDSSLININEICDNQGKIYFNQRGAGCGKTYESIQLIQNDARFHNKETFIYLTKMHSAKDVINSEFVDQGNSGKLNPLVLNSDNTSGKQYKKSYITDTNKELKIIIGTIDSFNYALVDDDKIISCIDRYRGIVQSIKAGHIALDTGNAVYYAQQLITLDKKCLIIVDEAQDLCEDYIEAFHTLIIKTNIDVFIIGDKLQSLWDMNNTHTYINKVDLGDRVEMSNSINRVMRFHNEQFINFVNKIIPFAKYDLPPIDGICNIPCKYKHETIKPYTIFEVPDIYSRDFDYHQVMSNIEKIITYMEREITKEGYLPNNFMFIFPILTNNIFAVLLRSRLHKFWIDKFNDETYQEILKRDSFWKDKINDNNYYEYAVIHKSDEGNSINLRESENSSRILSIHASKGVGCEVVFVLGINERTLCIFSEKKNNLKYDSLLHVAITRQKKSLYIGVEMNSDDIHNRFKQMDIIEDKTILPNLRVIKTHNSYKNIRKYIDTNDAIFTEIDQKIIKANNYMEILPPDSDKHAIIDFGHHMIRYCVFKYNIMSNIILHEPNEDICCKNQFITILRTVSRKSVINYEYDKYYEKLREITNTNKKNQDNNFKNVEIVAEIPLLSYSNNKNTKYYKYNLILNKIIKIIQAKIQAKIGSYNLPVGVNKYELPPLCSLECVILLFMLDVIKNGIYSNISISEVYHIMYCYDNCSSEITDNHSDIYGCACKECFKENKTLGYNEIASSITNHYATVIHINSTYCNYNKYITEHLKITDMRYNIDHKVWFGKKNSNFSIATNFDIIGYSSDYVIYFIIKPQFNVINFNKITCDALIYNFILLNCGDFDQDDDLNQNKIKNKIKNKINNKINNNKIRYLGKKIYACIFTLDSNEPVFYDLNIDKNNEVLIQTVRQYLLNTYSEHHKLIHRYYQYCRDNNIDFTENTKQNSKLPEYIREYLHDIKRKMMKCKNDATKIVVLMQKINDNFIDDLDERLNMYIDEYLNINQTIYSMVL